MVDSVLTPQFQIHQRPQQLYLYRHSDDPQRPTLFFLHGGPGWPDSPWAGFICHSLWKSFNTLHWDQPGCHRSVSEGTRETVVDGRDFLQGLRIQDLVDDAIAIAERAREEWNLKDLILMGHSWGAMFGVKVAQQAPNLFRGLITIGQLVANSRSEPLSWQYALERSRQKEDLAAVKELESMGPDFYRQVDPLYRQREILFDRGGEFHRPVSLEDFKRWIDLSPAEYRSDWDLIYPRCRAPLESLCWSSPSANWP